MKAMEEGEVEDACRERKYQVFESSRVRSSFIYKTKGILSSTSGGKLDEVELDAAGLTNSWLSGSTRTSVQGSVFRPLVKKKNRTKWSRMPANIGHVSTWETFLKFPVT